MHRRETLKILAISTLTAPFVLNSCKSKEQETAVANKAVAKSSIDRFKEEAEADEQIMKGQFFTAHEMATIAVLSDIIIPADEVSGSATDSGVTDFIEFIVKDKPEFQIPMRGGLRWMDMESMKRFEKSFKDADVKQQLNLVDEIAYPKKAKPAMMQGVSFFSLMRNLTATGFYTSEIGIKDIQYMGNKPNQWNGVPDDVLKQYGLAYTQRELNESISFD
ncbi:MAG: gluconate 2-dehydrogenase subunit 3 family protein [Bacteroidota bacterium]|nr:gluconate 2-dehydrogenase subunit 3 family protein [Bacteroidota bacterium]